MPGPEGVSPCHPAQPEPFILAARFLNEPTARHAYFGVQEIVFRSPLTELSVYRFQLRQAYHVALLGEKPSVPLEQRLRRLLSIGEFTTLPDAVLSILFDRRATASSLGGWAEGHYRPGLPL